MQNKRLKRIENRPHSRLKDEQEKLDKLIFEQYEDYAYSYDFLNDFKGIFEDRGFDDWLDYRDFAIKHDYFITNVEVLDIAVILKFLKENLETFQFDNKLAVSVHYSAYYRVNKALNDQAFAYLNQLSSEKINKLINTFIIPSIQAYSKDREKTNNQEFDDLLNCMVQAGISGDPNEFDDIVQRNWKQIVDEHNQKLKQCWVKKAKVKCKEN